MENIIELRQVTRNYKSVTGVVKREKGIVEAVKPLSFSIKRGEIFGLLGPNGAGKTTTIKMMTTLLTPSEGQLLVLGHDCANEEKMIRPKINFVFGGERNLYWRLSCLDNLKFFADLYHVPRKKQGAIIENILKRVGLFEVKDRKVETFSKGMKQRLQIAKSLLNNPEILFLDEPTIGLDPLGAKQLREIIREIASDDTTVVLTTHYMPEAEELCDRIAIINNGQLVALDNVAGLRNRINEPTKLRIPNDNLSEEECLRLKALPYVSKLVKLQKNNFVDLHTNEVEKVLHHVVETMGNQKIRGVQIQDVSLEDVYVELVGGSHAI